MKTRCLGERGSAGIPIEGFPPHAVLYGHRLMYTSRCLHRKSNFRDNLGSGGGEYG